MWTQRGGRMGFIPLTRRYNVSRVIPEQHANELQQHIPW